MLAGAARVEITPPAGVPLMGYGARQGPARSVAAPLFARSLALAESPEDPGIIVVSADLCLIGPGQARGLREQIQAGTGVPPERVLVACTHTHSGPDTGLAEVNAGRALPAAVEPVFAGVVEAGLRAFRDLQPARLGWSRAEAHIGRNRRLRDGPLDPSVSVLRVERSDRSVLGVAFVHACHGTVLGHDNLEISPDWPGVACERIESTTGATALFLLGAHADVDPRTRGLMDVAIPGQSVGLGHDAVRILGCEVADAVLGVLDEIACLDAPVGAAVSRVGLPIHLGELPPDVARRHMDERKREVAELLGVDVASLPRLSQIWQPLEDRARELPVEEARECLARVRLYVRDKTAPFFVGGERSLDVETQVLRIGDAALLALPLEPTTQVGLDWKSRHPAAALGGVVGIGNGWLRYLPHPDDLAHPRAHQHYEVLQSLFAPGACERLLDAAEADLQRLFSRA